MDDFLINFSQKLKDQNFDKIHINRGGCGRAAVEFYKYFRKLNKYEVLGIRVLSDMSPKLSPRKTDKTSCLDMYFHHIVLAIKHEGIVYYVDAAYGIVPQSRYHTDTVFRHLKPMTGYINLKRMQSYLNRPGTWNTVFNVQKINKIRKFLKEGDSNERSIRNRTLPTRTQRASRTVKGLQWVR